jgi:Lipocalin-like domain
MQTDPTARHSPIGLFRRVCYLARAWLSCHPPCGAVAVPNWVGTDQQRSVERSGDRLTLSASPLLLAGKQQVPRLVWERVDPLPRGRLIG